MSVSSIITGGLGPWGSASKIITGGYSSAAPIIVQVGHLSAQLLNRPIMCGAMFNQTAIDGGVTIEPFIAGIIQGNS